MLGNAKQLKQMIHDMIRDVHTCIPGEIKSFDASKCIGNIQPSGKFKKADGSYLDYPELSNVPVVFLQSMDQKATIAYPIKEGDGCLLFFAEQQLDYWKDGRTPKSDLRHGLSNAIAVVGLFTEGNSVMEDACNDDAVIIDREKTRVVVKKEEINVLIDKDSKDTEITAKTDKVHVKRGGTEFTIEDGKVTINATNVVINGELNVSGKITSADLETPVSAFNTHIHLCTAPSTPSSLPFPEGTSIDDMLATMPTETEGNS